MGLRIWQLWREAALCLIRKRNLIIGRVLLIYEMPKTGSQTIEATLQQTSWPYPIFRFHYLSERLLEPVRRWANSATTSEAWKQNAQWQLAVREEICQLIRVRRLLRACRIPIPKLEIITGVRDLLGVGISSIFENHRLFVSSLEDMTASACREILVHPKTLGPLGEWFNLELGPYLGIDVFRTPFPADKGFVALESSFARVLLYRYENFDLLPLMLQEFLGLEIPAVVNRNIGTCKEYGPQYQQVRTSLGLPGEFVTTLYHSKIMRHFYSETELQKFKTMWTRSPKGQDRTAEPAPA